MGLSVVEYLKWQRADNFGAYVFAGQRQDNTLGSFSNHCDTARPAASLATIANDLGFTEVTIAALVGHAKGSVTSNSPIRLTLRSS
jgi:hypothetical protein